VREWRNNNFSGFRTHTDDLLQYAQIPLVYGLDWAGVKAKNDFLNRSLLLAKSEILMTIIVRIIKPSAQVLRPDASNYHAFPSGHTAQAFVAATFMHKEYGEKSVWYSIGAYSLATSVGALRILNNKHWISDVLAGAGIGILSTNVVYMTHRYRWGKRPNLTVLPTYSNGPGVYMALKLGN
jgi:membrane-associated phospholipid phosphatase